MHGKCSTTQGIEPRKTALDNYESLSSTFARFYVKCTLSFRMSHYYAPWLFYSSNTERSTTTDSLLGLHRIECLSQLHSDELSHLKKNQAFTIFDY